MHRFSKTIDTNYSAADMFRLVNDVETYPQFIPGCQQSLILKQDDHSMEVQLSFDARGLQQNFVTCNRFVANQHINMTLVRGPFRHLQGQWSFNNTSQDKCSVTLELEFVFANRILDKLAAPAFSHLTGRMVQAFCDRAYQVYGPPPTNTP